MNLASSLLVSCGGPELPDSFAVRSDNLATLMTYEGCRTLQSKHYTSISTPFILTVYIDRAKRLASSHITSYIPKGECSLMAGVSCIASGNNYFAAGSEDGTIRLWRITDGQLVIEQQLHLGPLTVLYIDTNLWLLYAASKTGRVGAWSIPELYSSGEPEKVWPIHNLSITDMIISTNNRIFTVSLDKTVKCIDFCLGGEILSVNFPVSLTCCCLAKNESILYCGGTDGTIFQIYISQDNGTQRTFLGHTSEITDLVTSSDDRCLFSSSLDKTIRRWDTATGQTLNHIQTNGVPFALNFLPQIDKATATAAIGSNEEGRRSKQARKNDSNKKKGFPKLQPVIAGNIDEIVSAPAEEVPILTAEEELTIAISDISAHYSSMPNEVVQNHKEENILENSTERNENENTKSVEDEQNESELSELRRQNGQMFQYILSKQNK